MEMGAPPHRLLWLDPHLCADPGLHGLRGARGETARDVGRGPLERDGGRDADDVVRIFAACGTYSEIAAAIEARYGGLADAIELELPGRHPAGLQRELVADIRRIPHRFEGFDTNW